MSKNLHKGSNSAFSLALKKAGFVVLPRLWVKHEDMQAIYDIAYKHAKTINQLRKQVRQELPDDSPQEKDPVKSKDAAWEAFEEEQRKRQEQWT